MPWAQRRAARGLPACRRWRGSRPSTRRRSGACSRRKGQPCRVHNTLESEVRFLESISQKRCRTRSNRRLRAHPNTQTAFGKSIPPLLPLLQNHLLQLLLHLLQLPLLRLPLLRPPLPQLPLPSRPRPCPVLPVSAFPGLPAWLPAWPLVAHPAESHGCVGQPWPAAPGPTRAAPLSPLPPLPPLRPLPPPRRRLPQSPPHPPRLGSPAYSPPPLGCLGPRLGRLGS
mmetsp:Transcript_13163/g.31129  ORF Transcript_13163/g.31129 Transcript_13163/m.31129 type:complete len:227 (-) Transcript_13163:770-1450(-)